MTFVAASHVNDNQVRDDIRELSGSAEAAAHVAAVSLADRPVGHVGLEIEAHCIDIEDPRRRPDWSEIEAVRAALPPLPGRSRVTVEPGGAVELSGPPLPDPLTAITALSADQRVLTATLSDAGLALLPLGADPMRAPRRINPGARYAAMERFFEATGTGAAGAAMMTSTAAMQINLEAGPSEDWSRRVALAHALGPTMIAIAANSPMLAGRFTGWVSTRQQIWGQLDTARCGPVLGGRGLDPATDWARYALKAPVMLVHAPDAVAVTQRVPFADWADGRVALGGRRPTTADLDYHLTTLFPPVRPRRWLEIRYLDALPDTLWPAVVFTLATLLDDPQAAEVAAEIVAPVATAWDTAARLGLHDRHLHESALACVRVAAALAPPELVAPMRALCRTVELGRCASDDFSDSVVRLGLDAAVSQLAQGNS